jgi:hypothetical protein
MKYVREIVATVVLVGAPRVALACPVCFGDANEPMTIAATNGIWFMLGIVAAMLTAFGTFFVYLVRRARLAARLADAAHTGLSLDRHHFDHHQLDHHQGQEGTAQC